MGYDVVLVASTPVELSAHTFTDVGRINAPNSISFENTLNRDGNAVVSLDPFKQSDAVKTQLRTLDTNPCEIAIYKDSSLWFQGPVIVPQVQGRTLVLNAKGMFYYTKYMIPEVDLTHTLVDQWIIARGLIESYQDLAYGNYALDVSAVTTSGVTRTVDYIAADLHVVFDAIIDLAETDNGFDFDIGVHATEAGTHRVFRLYASKGSDLSGSVKFDVRPITDPNVHWSVTAGNIASEARTIGYGEDDSFITSNKSNTALRVSFGRCSVGESYYDVSSQGQLDDKAQGLVDERAVQLFKPGPSLFAVTNVGIEDFDVGDTVEYSYDVGLGVQTFDRRVLRKRVRINPKGQEFMDVEFV